MPSLLAESLTETRNWVVVYAAASAATTATVLLFPTALAATADAVLAQNSTTTPLAAITALIVTAALAVTMAEIAEAKASSRTTAHLRHRLLRQILAWDLRGQRAFPTGDILARFLHSTSESSRLVPALGGGLVSTLTSLGGIVALFLIDPLVGLTFLAGIPAIWLIARVFFRRSTGLTQDYQRLHGEIATRFQDAIRGHLTIRAAASAERETARILEVLPHLRKSGIAFFHAQRSAGWQVSILGPILQVGVLATAGYGVAAGRVSPGELLAVSGYLGLAFGLFQHISLLSNVGQARGSSRRLRELLDTPASRGHTAIPRGAGALRLRHIHVSADGRPILNGIDLEVPAGSCVAIVGTSGAGKSTMAAVAGGLLRPDAGSVTLDGLDIASAAPEALADEVAYAFEDPKLLGMTVRDAIAYGGQLTDEAPIVKALHDSDAAGFVAKLPLHLDTPLSGLRLSGGEFQRLGLARAFNRRARLLILDDATSSVDALTEQRIADALHAQQGTRLIVTHRKSTAERADLVLWLEQGKIAGFGPHRDLQSLSGYTALFRSVSQAQQQKAIP